MFDACINRTMTANCVMCIWRWNHIAIQPKQKQKIHKIFCWQSVILSLHKIMKSCRACMCHHHRTISLDGGQIFWMRHTQQQHKIERNRSIQRTTAFVLFIFLQLRYIYDIQKKNQHAGMCQSVYLSICVCASECLWVHICVDINFQATTDDECCYLAHSSQFTNTKERVE